MTTIFDSLRSRHLHTRSRQTRRDGRRPGRKAVLEFQPGRDVIALEDRTMLSSVSWINPAGGDWNTGSNWNTGSVPGASDDVTIDLSPGITVTHSQDDADSVNTLTLAGADTLSLSNGSLSIESASTIDGPLNLTGGTLEGAGTLTVTGALTWSGGGTMAGTGQTIATGAVSISSGTLDTRSFTNEGTANLSGTLSFDNSAGFTNAATATLSAQTGAYLSRGDSSSPTFTNGGSFDVEAGAGNTVTDNGVAFTNAGTVAVSSGTLALLDPGGTDSGSFTVALNATLDFGEKATTLSSQSSVSGAGTVNFGNNGTTTIYGGYNLHSVPPVVYATAHSPESAAYLFGTLDLATGQFTQISTTNELMNSLTDGLGGLYAGGNDGNLYTISPSGATSEYATVTVPSNQTTASLVGLAAEAEGGAGFFTDSVTANYGDGTLTATLDHISADGKSQSVIGIMGEKFGNANTGNLAFGPDEKLYFDSENVSGIPSLYVVNRATGVATGIGHGLNTANPLTLVSNGSVLYGIDTYAATNPAIYAIDTTTGVATEIGTVSGLGDGYSIDTMAPPPAPITPTSTTTVQNDAVVNFDGTLTSLGGELDITSGTANLGSNSLNLDSLDLSGGTLTGTGKLTVTGALTWTGGTMAGTGQTIAEGAVSIDNGKLDTRSFTNEATATLAGGLYFAKHAVVTNAASGTFDAQAGAALDLDDSSAPTFRNAGTFNAQAGGGNTVTDNGVAFINTGTVNVTSGTLSLSDMTLSNASSGTYNWSGGTLDVTKGTFTNSGTITISNYSFVNLDGTLTNNSVINQTGSGTLQLGTGSRLTNNAAGTYDLQGDGSVAGGTLTSTGTLEKTEGTGISTISSAVNSTGKVIVDTGTLILSGPVTQVSGTILTAGTWQAAGTKSVAAELNITSTYGITTIGASATVALYGPNSTFDNIKSLTTNQGSFNLLGGQAFTTYANLTNSSKLTLSPGSVLTVGGNFTETSAGALTLEMGRTATGPTIGSISATDTIRLAGGLTLTSTVTPAIGTVFNVVNNRGTRAIAGLFASHPKGSTITLNRMHFMISYVGGDKRHSVTLTRVK